MFVIRYLFLRMYPNLIVVVWQLTTLTLDYHKILLISSCYITSIKLLSWIYGIITSTLFCSIAQWNILYYEWCLLETAWRRAKGMTTWSAVLQVVSVSASYSRCYNLALSLLFPYVLKPHVLHMALLLTNIYSIDTILYPYALPLHINSHNFSQVFV